MSRLIFFRNLIIGLGVSFVALSLGAAFGILSGRGAFAGMISAGIIALLTSILGGTRIQCSGPTAPMSVVAAAVIAVAYDQIATKLPDVAPDHFINAVFLMAGVVILLMAALRLGRFITLVPNVVISGFMNGIALLIWVGQIKKLLGIGNSETFDGPMVYNCLIAAITVIFLFSYPILVKAFQPHLRRYIPPGTLAVLIVMTGVVQTLMIPIETITLSVGIKSIHALSDLIISQWPRDWSVTLIILAIPFALQLAFLCYLDTLLTSLVVDRMTSEKTRQNKELAAQGIANGAVALVGGIPGAQATIRSVLVIKEGGSHRIVGVFIGLFVLLELILFQDIIELIPQAVFVGILIKAGYDVCDLGTVMAYLRRFSRRNPTDPSTIYVAHVEMLIITGTTLVTVFWDLNIAVGIFTIFFYIFNKIVRPKSPIQDLKPKSQQTEK